MSFVMPPHRHDMHEFFVCLNEHATQHAEGQSCAFQRGRAFLLYSGCRHQVEFKPEVLAEFIFVCFDKNHLAESGYMKLQEQLQKGHQKQCYFSGDDPEYLESNVKTISLLHEEISSSELLRDDLVNALLVQLLVAFFRNTKPGAWASSEMNEKRDRVIKLCHRMALDPSIEMTLEQAAVKTSMCRSSFAGLVKETTGLTWREYVMDCRLKKSIVLLAEKDIQISEVAFECNFNNIGYFHRAFLEKYGNTPGRMRKILQQNRYPHLLKEYT